MGCASSAPLSVQNGDVHTPFETKSSEDGKEDPENLLTQARNELNQVRSQLSKAPDDMKETIEGVADDVTNGINEALGEAEEIKEGMEQAAEEVQEEVSQTKSDAVAKLQGKNIYLFIYATLIHLVIYLCTNQ